MKFADNARGNKEDEVKSKRFVKQLNKDRKQYKLLTDSDQEKTVALGSSMIVRWISVEGCETENAEKFTYLGNNGIKIQAALRQNYQY